MLVSEPVMNLFRDIKKLNFKVQNGTSFRWEGLIPEYKLETHRVNVRRRSDGTYNTTTNDQTDTNLRIWLDYHLDQYSHQAQYPDDLQSEAIYTTTSSTCKYVESTASQSYRNYHRYVEVAPFAVVKVVNEYTASWEGSATGDHHSTTKYILAKLPVSGYTDMLNTTEVSVGSLTSWASSVFNFANLEQYADNITGQFPAANSRSRQRTAYIDVPYWTYWVFHFKYCSLEDVNIPDPPSSSSSNLLGN